MKNISKISIRQKLMRVIVIVGMVTVLLAALLFTLFQIQQIRNGMINELATLARVLGNNTQVALAFDIPTDAKRVLEDLKDNSFINQAIIYKENGELFAFYYKDSSQAASFTISLEEDFYKFHEDQLLFHQIIKDKTGKLGSIFLAAGLDELDHQIMQNLNATIIIIIISLLICYALSLHLHQSITLPIRNLSDTTNKIRESEDYNIRVEQKDYVEIDNLCKGFNSMLDQIQSRERSLQELARFDTLTKLPNRPHFMEILEKAVKRGKRKSHRHAILFLDLDRFKNINDSLGHSAGDKLLIDVAKRLLFIIRGDDTVGRLGGDEYVFLLQEISSTNEAAEIANRIIEVLNDPFLIDGHQVVITPSIGIVIYPDHGSSPEDLIKNADTAMYQAKQMGGNNFRYFTDEMNFMAIKRQQMEEALHNAFRNDEIIVHYQPQINASNHSISGMEALCRWQRSAVKLIPPNDFIPIAEESGLIVPLTDIILDKAVNKIKHWVEQGIFQQKVAINVASRQFKQTDIVETFDTMLKNSNLLPEHFEIEITEAAVMDHTDISIERLKKIKDIGITVAIDDFGTGYSSLSYLKKFPIDKLKIDKSFIHDMDETENDMKIVSSIIELGHNLDLQIVAEGVEKQSQVDLLTDMGCDILQGYYFSKPVDDQNMEQLLKQPDLI